MCLLFGSKANIQKMYEACCLRVFIATAYKHVLLARGNHGLKLMVLAFENMLKSRGSPCVYTSTSYDYDCVGREGKCVL